VKQTLSHIQRLHQRKDFEGALKTKAITDKWLAIHCETNEHAEDCLGMVVTKRTVPKATARNRIKRQIREVFRTNQSPSPSSLNIVVRLRKAVLPAEMAEFRRVMSLLLMKVRNNKNDAPVSKIDKGISVSD
jgi:ribonuclease P protein component